MAVYLPGCSAEDGLSLLLQNAGLLDCQPAGLLSLPALAVELLASSLDTPDWQSLRLSCSSICDALSGVRVVPHTNGEKGPPKGLLVAVDEPANGARMLRKNSLLSRTSSLRVRGSGEHALPKLLPQATRLTSLDLSEAAQANLSLLTTHNSCLTDLILGPGSLNSISSCGGSLAELSTLLGLEALTFCNCAPLADQLAPLHVLPSLNCIRFQNPMAHGQKKPPNANDDVAQALSPDQLLACFPHLTALHMEDCKAPDEDTCFWHAEHLAALACLTSLQSLSIKLGSNYDASDMAGPCRQGMAGLSQLTQLKLLIGDGCMDNLDCLPSPSCLPLLVELDIYAVLRVDSWLFSLPCLKKLSVLNLIAAPSATTSLPALEELYLRQAFCDEFQDTYSFQGSAAPVDSQPLATFAPCLRILRLKWAVFDLDVRPSDQRAAGMFSSPHPTISHVAVTVSISGIMRRSGRPPPALAKSIVLEAVIRGTPAAEQLSLACASASWPLVAGRDGPAWLLDAAEAAWFQHHIRLRALHMHGCGFTAAGCMALSTWAPRLSQLVVSHLNTPQQQGIMGLAKFGGLREVTLRCCSHPEAGALLQVVRELAELPLLQDLTVEECEGVDRLEFVLLRDEMQAVKAGLAMMWRNGSEQARPSEFADSDEDE